jgi:hypothetical protein
MTDMQPMLPLLIVWSSILNPVMHFSTQPLIGEMKCPIGYTFVLPFHFISSNVDATHALTLINIWYDPLHIITWPYWFIDLDLTCSSTLLRSIGGKSWLKLPRHAVYHFKASDLPFTLATRPSSQASSWSSPPSHMTPCHVLYAMSSFITCVSFATYPSHFYFHGMGYSHKCTYGLITCVSYIKHILVYLGCHLITKTKLGTFQRGHSR